MIGEQKNNDDGFELVQTKVPQHVKQLLDILAGQRGMSTYELLQLLIDGFISAAKHDGPIDSEHRMLLESIKLDVAFSKAFNFASPTAKTEIAQMILILQQPGKKGFGLTMITKPFLDTPTVTRCLDDIVERVLQVSMPGIYKRLEKVGERLLCQSKRETLTLLSEYMNDSLDKEEEQSEMPGYGTFHDFGKDVVYGQKHKRVPHRTPDSVANQQQRIVFTDDDREVADYEARDWEGSQRNPENDEPPIRPFGVEW